MDAAALATALGYLAWRFSILRATYYDAISFQWLSGTKAAFRLTSSHSPDLWYLPMVIAFWLVLRMLGPIRRASDPARRADVSTTLLSERRYVQLHLARPLLWALLPSLLFLGYWAFAFWLDWHRFGRQQTHADLMAAAIRASYFDALGLWAAMLAATLGVLAHALWRACCRTWGAVQSSMFYRLSIAPVLLYGFHFGYGLYGAGYVDWREATIVVFYGTVTLLGAWMVVRYVCRACRDCYILE